MGQPQLKRTEDPVLAKAKAERRRFRRVRVDLAGRLFFPATAHEVSCNVADLSPGGASLDCEHAPESGTQVVLYIDGFGRFEGTAVRRDGRPGFGMRFNATALKREKIAEQLTQFTRADGTVIKCEVLDLSPTGVSVKTAVRPLIGEFVLIGQLAGRVARH